MTLYRCLLIDVFFAKLLQRRDMVERRRGFKTTTLQRRHNIVCLLGLLTKHKLIHFNYIVNNLRSQETLKSSHLKSMFFSSAYR